MLSVLKARDLNFVIDLNLRLRYEILNLLVTFNKEVMRSRNKTYERRSSPSQRATLPVCEVKNI